MDQTLIKQKRIHLKNATFNKKIGSMRFKTVQSADTMLLEGQVKKELISKNVTDQDILDEVAISIEDRVTPYHHLPYPEQIKKKSDWLANEVLPSFTREFEVKIKENREFPPMWYADIHRKHIDEKTIEPVCPLEKVIECDQDYIEGYRNKVEFTIGRSFGGLPIGEENKGEICIGFNQGNMSKGIMFVGKPDNIKVISKESVIVAKKFEGII
jgi:hypothetical protein